MILKFWPRWPRKQPLNLSSLKGPPLDFNLNGIFEISGLHWSKWAIACFIWRTFIFWIFSLQPPRLLTNLKNESFPNKTSYSSFWSVEATDFKNVILDKIHWVRYLLDFDLRIHSGQVWSRNLTFSKETRAGDVVSYSFFPKKSSRNPSLKRFILTQQFLQGSLVF